MAVEVGEGVEAGALESGWEAGRVFEVEDRRSGGAEEGALVDRGEEPGAPEGGAAGRAAAGGEDDVSGEVLVFGAEAVGEPGAGGGEAELGLAALHEELAGVVVELVGVERLDFADVVGAGGDVGEEVGEPHAGLAVL